MPITRKGKMTKERILQCAKELYYENGFNNTTIQGIADKAHSTLGSMTYHFATKTEFINTIFSGYVNSIYEVFSDLTKSTRSNAIKRQLTMNYLYLTKIFEDEKIASFYNEIVNIDEYFKSAHKAAYSIFHGQTTVLSLEQKIAYSEANAGAHQSMVRAWFDGKLRMNIEEFIDFVITYEYSAENITLEEIEKTLKEARKFYEANAEAFSTITLLP